MPAEAQAKARQILRKVLEGSMIPEAEWWSFVGYSRFDKVLAGGVKHGITVVLSPEAAALAARRISGGSDAGVFDVQSISGPPRP